jgi:hypothetical protein
MGLVAVLLFSLLAIPPLAPRMINPYDEGMVAYGAERVLNGQRPAVDFYTPYGPGVFYLLAAAYRLFGVRLLVERWTSALLLVVIGGLSYLLLLGRQPAGEAIPLIDNGPPQRPDARSGEPHPAPEGRIAEEGLVLFAVVTSLVVVLMLASGWWYTPVNGGVVALMLLTGLALQRGLRTGSPTWAAAAGVGIGLTLLWRVTFGGALLLASAITWAFTVGGETSERRQQRRNVGLIGMVAVAVVLALPIYAGLIAAGGRRALQSLLVWPLTSTGAADLPWPPCSIRPPRGDDSTLAALAAATHGASFYYGVVALLLLFWRLPLRAVTLPDRQLGLWLLLLLPPMFLYAHGRTDYSHITPLLCFSLLLAGLAVLSGLTAAGGQSAVGSRQREDRTGATSGSQTGAPETSRPGMLFKFRELTSQLPTSVFRLPSVASLWRAVGATVWLASILLLVPTIAYSIRNIWQSPGRHPLDLPGQRGAGVYAPFRYSRQYRILVPLIQEHVAPAQRLYSGTVQHDVFLTNDSLLYFLSERNAATYYWCLDASVTTSAPVQEEMVAELERGGVAAAVLWTAPRPVEENAGGRSSGVHRLDDWLEREFILVRVPGVMYDLRLRHGFWSEQ